MPSPNEHRHRATRPDLVPLFLPPPPLPDPEEDPWQPDDPTPDPPRKPSPPTT